MSKLLLSLCAIYLTLSLPLWAEREYTDEQIAFWEDEAFPVLERTVGVAMELVKKSGAD